MGFFDDIPDDPELAFLQLEKIFRDERSQELEGTDYNHSSVAEDLRYISRTLAARTELGLEVLRDWNLPTAFDHSTELFHNFLRDVDHYRTILEIRHSRRNKGLTVRFDATAKSKLRHHAAQIREFVDRLELDDWKRDDLYKAINAFELEIDRDRSRLGVFGDLVVKCGGILGEAAEKAEPVRKWIDSISRLIWGAEMKERTESLPAPSEKRQIPGPPKQIPPPKPQGGPGRRTDMDDEIPF